MELPIVLERTYSAPIDLVWKALTDAKTMKEWYFDIPNFKPEVGFKFEFWAGESEEKQFHHECVITQVVSGSKIAYTWRYPGYEGNSEVIFELFPEGQGTRVKLTHLGLETFPQSNPDFAPQNFQGGWTYFLTEALAGFLAK